MPHESLLHWLHGRGNNDFTSLDDWFDRKQAQGWNRLCDCARSNPGMVDDLALEIATRRRAEAPGSFFALLIYIAAKSPDRQVDMIARFRKYMPEHPRWAMGAAGYNLHEFNALLDTQWLADADRYVDADPEGAWGIFESAAMYRPEIIVPDTLDAWEARRSMMPRDYFVSWLHLALHWKDRTGELLGRVLRAFPEHPAEAVEATSFSARSESTLITPEIVAAVLKHFDAAPEKAWEFFDGASRAKPSILDDTLLDTLAARPGPGTFFSILGHLVDIEPGRVSKLLDYYVAAIRRYPEKGIESVRYAFQREGTRHIRPDLVKAVTDGFPAAAYAAYEFLWSCFEDRPELINAAVVAAALKNIPHATNRAFGFFKELLKLRPEFTRECTLALFECLAEEPVHRAFVRAEEMESIIAISEAAHIKTGLENALREAVHVGSRRARALLAIMFRQKSRARRHVLLEALRFAATTVMWRKDGPAAEKYSPVWDFLFFIIDNSGDDAVSTAAAEKFLEGAFQLHYLCHTGYEHDGFLRKLDLSDPPARPLPPGIAADSDLSYLHRLVLELGTRFNVQPRLSILEDFGNRMAAAESELRAIPEKGTRLRARRRNLTFQIECWKNPDYIRAFDDPEREKLLPEDARKLLKREKKDFAKHLRDTLRAEAIRIAIGAIDLLRQDLYRKRLADALGHEVDIETVEPKILPAFLWFHTVGSMKNNSKYLRMLVEDRIAHRPHDWMRTEPPAQEWAEKVRGTFPNVHLDRWRAPFEKVIQYRPKDALAEKKRRIKADLAQVRGLLEKVGAKGIASETYEELAAKLAEVANPPTPKEGEKKPPPPDPAVLDEISMNLERVRIAVETPDSDFEGRIVLSVESDPFEILFMGEYGFASCLSLRGSNAWSAVSNAIDIDKTVCWARDPGGNVVGRRLVALTSSGVLMFRTYTNRHGLGLDRFFDQFVEEYAIHCGVRICHDGQAGPLLSDRWYDDHAI